MDFENKYRPAIQVNPFLRKKPEFARASIDDYGMVQVDFSDDLVVPEYDDFNSDILKISVLPSGFVDEEMLKFEWQVVNFEMGAFKIQITFENPLLISSNGPKALERL